MPKKENPKVNQSFRFDRDLVDRIEALAKEANLNKTKVVEDLLELGLSHYQKMLGGR